MPYCTFLLQNNKQGQQECKQEQKKMMIMHIQHNIAHICVSES